MDREIKFRGWNKSTKKMIDLHKITSLALSEGMKEDGLYIPFVDDVELMQFTGLKDKNGNEIYEGDIVVWNSGNKGNIKSQVFYDKKLFCPMVFEPVIGFESIYKSPVSLYHCASISEIKGNVFETPHLIVK